MLQLKIYIYQLFAILDTPPEKSEKHEKHPRED